MIKQKSNRVLNGLYGLGLALVLGVAVYGQGGTEQKVSFYLDGKVGSELVKKGVYTLAVPETEQGKLEIKVGKKVVTAAYTKRATPSESDSDKMTYRDNGDGTRSIASITPRGRKYTLVLLEDGKSVANSN